MLPSGAIQEVTRFRTGQFENLFPRETFHRTLTMIHKDFEQAKETILAAGEWNGWCIMPDDTLNFRSILEPVRSDPFIPDDIREAVIALMERRLKAVSDISGEIIHQYRNDLASGKIVPRDDNWVELINEMNGYLAKQNCAGPHVQRAVHDIRQLIQNYFDQFNPHGVGMGRRKTHEKLPDDLR